MYKAQKIYNREAWFRSIRPGDVSKGKFDQYKDLKTISVQLAVYNAANAEKKDVYLHAKYISKELSVILVGVPFKQRQKELKNPKYKNEWRNLIKEWVK